MAVRGGWIKLHRGILENPIFDDSTGYLLQLWVYILMSVNWKDKRILWNGKELTLKAGEGIFGLNKITKDLTKIENKDKPEFKKMKILYYRRLKILETLGNIKLYPTNKFTIVKVVNWKKYQDKK